MSRIGRTSVGDYVYHVLNRANARVHIFDDDKDYLTFEAKLLGSSYWGQSYWGQSPITHSSFANTKVDSVHFVAYPNPFSNPLKLSYTLKKACNIQIMVSRLQTAIIVYKGSSIHMEAGNHENEIKINALPGIYIATLTYGNQIKSAIVFKY